MKEAGFTSKTYTLMARHLAAQLAPPRHLAGSCRIYSLLLGENAIQLLYGQEKTNSGELVPMTLGWHIVELDGLRYFYKEEAEQAFIVK